MDIEIRLKEILQAGGEAKHGKIQEIADALDVNRHSIRKLLNNEVKKISLETIGKLCDWLEERKLCEGLPAALFAARPSQFMQAVADPGFVTIVTGEYRSAEFPRRWVSRDDAAAASLIVQRLSRLDDMSRPQITHIHVPSHVPVGPPGEVEASDVEPDIKRAEDIFSRLRRDQDHGTTILIGSQRASYCVELFVSNLWRCPSFQAKGSTVPFYLKYEERPRVESCFGGDRVPMPNGSKAAPGIYYRAKEGEWKCSKSVPRRRGAGVVIVRRDPGAGHMEVAVMGLSAIATAAMGKILCEGSDKFWPPEKMHGGLEVGVYVCGFTLSGVETGEESIDLLRVGPAKIDQLDVVLPPQR